MRVCLLSAGLALSAVTLAAEITLDGPATNVQPLGQVLTDRSSDTPCAMARNANPKAVSQALEEGKRPGTSAQEI